MSTMLEKTRAAMRADSVKQEAMRTQVTEIQQALDSLGEIDTETVSEIQEALSIMMGEKDDELS